MKCNYADRILLGNIYDGISPLPYKGGVAIQGNKILAAGNTKQIIQYKNLATKTESFSAGLIMPGFHDNHVHLLLGGLCNKYPSLSSCTSEQECAEKMADFYKQHSDIISQHSWLLGFGWYNFWWNKQNYPTAKTLDQYFPEIPVFLLNADCHGAWINTKAMEICQIYKSTPEVPYGKIFRDKKGYPTGYLSENAMELVIPTAYNFESEIEMSIIEQVIKVFSANGVTSINDMQPFFGLNMARPLSLHNLEIQKKLNLRINFANNLFDDIKDTDNLSKTYSSGKIKHSGVKQFLDGIIPTYTSVMLENYTDRPDLDKEFPLSDYKKIIANVFEKHRHGNDIHLHATGDGAVRFALDCYEKAQQANGSTKSRLSIEHCDLISPEDFSRFGKMSIIASVQPTVLAAANSYVQSPYLKVLGKKREKNLWAFKTLIKNGAILSMGTDYPVADLNPFKGIYHALTRLYPDNTPPGGFYPEEKLTLHEALRAYTYGSAYMVGREKELGTLESGKFADIAILDKNLFEIPPEEILKTSIVETICDGKTVYKKN